MKISDLHLEGTKAEIDSLEEQYKSLGFDVVRKGHKLTVKALKRSKKRREEDKAKAKADEAKKPHHQQRRPQAPKAKDF